MKRELTRKGIVVFYLLFLFVFVVFFLAVFLYGKFSISGKAIYEGTEGAVDDFKVMGAGNPAFFLNPSMYVQVLGESGKQYTVEKPSPIGEVRVPGDFVQWSFLVNSLGSGSEKGKVRIEVGNVFNINAEVLPEGDPIEISTETDEVSEGNVMHFLRAPANENEKKILTIDSFGRLNVRVFFETPSLIYSEEIVENGKKILIENNAGVDYDDVSVFVDLDEFKIDPEEIVVLSKDGNELPKKIYLKGFEKYMVSFKTSSLKGSKQVFYVLLPDSKIVQLDEEGKGEILFSPPDFEDLESESILGCSKVNYECSEFGPCELPDIEDVFFGEGFGVKSRTCIFKFSFEKSLENCPTIVEESEKCSLGIKKEVDVNVVEPSLSPEEIDELEEQGVAIPQEEFIFTDSLTGSQVATVSLDNGNIVFK